MLFFLWPDPQYHTDRQFLLKRVAHAGGGLGKSQTYTNSYQALDANLARGYVYFELDFVFTSDNRLVCLHDWQGNFERTFGFATEAPLSLEAFVALSAANERWTNCELEGLAAWLTENPSAYIVTDVKERNLEALQQIRRTLPDASVRVIPQLYRPRNFDAVKELGFEQIIWTLYRYRHDSDRVLESTRRLYGPLAITMPRDRASSMLPDALKKIGIPTYVHTINSATEAELFIDEFGISEIYTDFLAPDGNAASF